METSLGCRAVEVGAVVGVGRIYAALTLLAEDVDVSPDGTPTRRTHGHAAVETKVLKRIMDIEGL
jgi:hypothetical protein